jgi:hypothetical protein
MIGGVPVDYGMCERCGSALTPKQQRRRARFCGPRCHATANRVPRQGPAEFTVFVDMVAGPLEKGAVAYGDKSFSQESEIGGLESPRPRKQSKREKRNEDHNRPSSQ